MKYAFTLCCAIILLGKASGQQTALDSTFGAYGRVSSLDIEPDYPVFCAQQGDGKLLTAATYGYNIYPTQTWAYGIRIQRWHPDGRPDSTFGSDGILEYGRYKSVLGIRALTNGKIIAVAREFGSVGAVRLNSDGTPDSSYQGAGFIIHASPNLWDAAILSDGGVIFTGNKSNSAGGYDLAVFKLDSAGNADASFGTVGTALYNFGSSTETFGIRIAEASGGKFLVSAVRDFPGSGTDSVGVLRILGNGNLDQSFGVGGAVFKYIPYTWMMRAEDVVEGPGGTITFAAFFRPPGDTTFFHRRLLRLTSDGATDASFGSNGICELTSIPPQKTSGGGGYYFYHVGGQTTLIHQPDGKLLVALTTGDNVQSYPEPCLLRLLPSGAYDPSFGVNGWMTSYMRPFTLASDVLVQPDGKIVQAGNGYDRVDMVRYKPISVLSVEPVASSSAIRIYPNPASDALRIEGIPDAATIRLFSASGSLLRTHYASGTLSLDDIPPGLYFLRITDGARSSTHRVVKRAE